MVLQHFGNHPLSRIVQQGRLQIFFNFYLTKTIYCGLQC